MAGGEYVCFGAGTLGTAVWGMSLMGTLGDGALGGEDMESVLGVVLRLCDLR